MGARRTAQRLAALGAALSVSMSSFHFILRQSRPVFSERFRVPVRRDWLNLPLLGGSALFGVGWGISGYCPGPAIAQLAAPNVETWVFLPALLVGSIVARLIQHGSADSHPSGAQAPTQPKA